MENIGINLKVLRMENGFTQEQVAKFLKVDQSLITKIENGERSINTLHLEKLCALYGCDVNSVKFLDSNKCIKIAYRAKDISIDDLTVISEIKALALNLRMMEELNEKNR